MRLLGVAIGAWSIAVLLVGFLAWQSALDAKMEIRNLRDDLRAAKSGH